MNSHSVAPDELKGQASGCVVAAAFPRDLVVKTLNQLPAKRLATSPAETVGGA